MIQPVAKLTRDMFTRRKTMNWASKRPLSAIELWSDKLSEPTNESRNWSRSQGSNQKMRHRFSTKEGVSLWNNSSRRITHQSIHCRCDEGPEVASVVG